MKHAAPLLLTAMTLLVAAPAARADDAAIVTYKSIAPNTALDLAKAALSTCRAHGYQVAVVVLDRFGQQLVLLRDRFAGRRNAAARQHDNGRDQLRREDPQTPHGCSPKTAS